MSATVCDVTGQAAERQTETRRQHDDRADEDGYESEYENGFAKFKHCEQQLLAFSS